MSSRPPVTDHRRLQRTLFRMQADPAFVAMVLGDDRRAKEATGLSDGDLELLRSADRTGVSADPGGKRRAQITGNAASEFLLTLAAASRFADDLLDGFPSSREFHRAVAEDGRLPFAFADYIWRRSRAWRDSLMADVHRLEWEMADLRRDVQRRARTIPSPHPPLGERRPSDRAEGEVVAEELAEGAVLLGPDARLFRLSRGAFAAAQALRAALDRDEPLPAPPQLGTGMDMELVLCIAHPPFSPHGLADVGVEVLTPPADAVFERARAPLSRDERAQIAAGHGAEPEELEAFLEPFVREGALLMG